MLIKDIFAAKVTRDIAPVVYFHEQDPQKVKDEVDEYIITGGYPESDPRHERTKDGIHEQFVSLLDAIAAELAKGRADLPASWISGFYGSGKSSFAKRIGLARDGIDLPDGTPLAGALLARDDSPNAKEFRDAWEKLRGQIDPMAVVFDVGSLARDDEHIHSVVKRLGQGNLEPEVKLALERLRDEGLVSYSEKLGYKVQSSAGQRGGNTRGSRVVVG